MDVNQAVSAATPPGLQNKDTPPGLNNQQKTPPGWSKGKKTGWTKNKVKPSVPKVKVVVPGNPLVIRE